MAKTVVFDTIGRDRASDAFRSGGGGEPAGVRGSQLKIPAGMGDGLDWAST